MGIIAWLVVGLIAGFLADAVVRSRNFGLVGDIVIGIVGAIVGGFLASAILNIPNPVNGINVTSIAVAFIGALILLFVLRAVTGRRRYRRRL